MSRFTFAAFAFVVLFSLVTAGKRCPGNEVYSDCGSACEPTCEDSGPQICTAQCVQGCFCRDGFVRNSNGRCVPLAACDCDD